MSSAMGVPVVTPWYTPDRICTVSDSWRCVTWREVPGRRRSSSGWMSASDSASPGGQPSTTQPIAGPWLSPKFATRKRWPKVLTDIARSVCGRSARARPSVRRRGPVVLDRPVADVGLEHAVLEVLAVDHGLGHVVERDHAHQRAVAHHRHVARMPAEHHAAHLVDLGLGGAREGMVVHHAADGVVAERAAVAHDRLDH